MSNQPTTRRAMAIDSYGGVEKLTLQTLPVPPVEAGDVLVALDYAGVAVWDAAERAGDLDELMRKVTGAPTRFPLIVGSEGAGTVAAVGDGVTHVKVGDPVYAITFLNPKGGGYTDLVVTKGELVRPIPKGLTAEAASTFAADASTALRGLQDTLKLRSGETVLIFGAGGGLGHFAVQLAKRLGAKVFAVASGDDGVALATQLGADAAVNGRTDDIVAAARAFAPDGIDAALLAAGGKAAEIALTTLKPGGRAAHPVGVEPAPKADNVDVQAFDGDQDADLLSRLDRLVESAPFTVHVARTFPLEQAAAAHRFLDEHFLGKLALKVR
jgi:NADPH:quinone reductase